MSLIGRIIFLVVLVAIIAAPIMYYFMKSSPSESTPNQQRLPLATINALNWCGSEEKLVAFTFDDGPSVLTTPILLADLARLSVPATFFLTPELNGPPTKTQCDLVAAIADAGHTIGTMGKDHTKPADKTDAELVASIASAEKWVSSCSPKTSVTMFRPPFGELKPEQAQMLSTTQGLDVASWTIDTLDVLGYSPSQQLDEVVAAQRRLPPNGSAIVLMHDKSYQPGGLDGIVKHYQQLGYTFVTMEKCRAACKSAVCRAPGNIWPGTFDIPF